MAAGEMHPTEMPIEGNGNRSTNGAAEQGTSFQTARLGIWLAIGSIAMFLGALAVLYVARIAEKPNYPFYVPKMLWASTVLLLVSSVTCKLAVAGIRRGDEDRLRRYLSATFVLGLLFLASQLYSWGEMIDAGLNRPDNPFSTLFYLMTGLHGAHLAVGLVWAGAVVRLASRGVFSSKRHMAVDLFSTYWHFMDVVWLVYFLLLVLL